MSIEEIQKFINEKISPGNEHVKISFKKREPVFGLFVRNYRDFSELKAKHFGRIVSRKNFDDYNKSGSIDLARIFSGSEFSRLTIYNESFE